MLPTIRVFEQFRLDLDAEQLTRNGAVVKIRPQALQVLILLTSRRGHTFSRDEIYAHLWGADETGIGDDAIDKAVSLLRKALTDAGADGEFIGTAKHRGYYFSEPFTEEPAPEPPKADPAPEPLKPGLPPTTPASPLPLPPPPPPRRPHLWLWAALIVILAAALGTAYLRFHPRPPASHVAHVVVLPVINKTGQPENDSIADGLTEELIAQLTSYGTGHFTVSPPTVTSTYKSKNPSFASLRKEAGADYVLLTSFHDNGFNLTVDSGLYRTEDGVNIFVRSYPTDSKPMRAQAASVLANGIVFAILGLPPSPWAPPPQQPSPSPR